MREDEFVPIATTIRRCPKCGARTQFDAGMIRARTVSDRDNLIITRGVAAARIWCSEYCGWRVDGYGKSVTT